jgi:hypothetical protein
MPSALQPYGTPPRRESPVAARVAFVVILAVVASAIAGGAQSTDHRFRPRPPKTRNWNRGRPADPGSGPTAVATARPARAEERSAERSDDEPRAPAGSAWVDWAGFAVGGALGAVTLVVRRREIRAAMVRRRCPGELARRRCRSGGRRPSPA